MTASLTVPRSPAGRPLPMPARIGVVLLAVLPVPIALPSVYGLLWVASYGSVGVLLAIRRPANPIGWLLLGLGGSLGLLSGQMDATPAQFTDGTLSPVEQGLAWLLGSVAPAAFLLFAILTAVFPSGRLPDGRWGAVLRVAIGIELVILGVTAFAPQINVNMPGYPDGAQVPNPLAIAPDAALWQAVPVGALFFVGIGVLALAAASLVARARRSSDVERQQIRWVAAVVAALVVAVIGGVLASTVIAGGIAYLPSILAFAALPASIGIAVLRYRLYEIDRIVSRTLGWTLATGIVVAVFTGAVLGLQALLAGMTEGQTLAVAGSTLVAFAVFAPVRRGVQRAVDRLFDRARYDAERVVGAFGERLRDQVDLASVETDIGATVREALRPGSISVWVRREVDG